MIILHENTEILTDQGDFPLNFFEGKTATVWNGDRWVIISPVRIKEKRQITVCEFICGYTYGNRINKINFETTLIGSDLCFSSRYHINKNIKEVELGYMIGEYIDNKKNIFTARLAGVWEEESENLFLIKESISLMAESLMVHTV